MSSTAFWRARTRFSSSTRTTAVSGALSQKPRWAVVCFAVCARFRRSATRFSSGEDMAGAFGEGWEARRRWWRDGCGGRRERAVE